MHPIQNPETARWGLDISEKDFAALKGGCRIRDMDDRWAFTAMTALELSIELSGQGMPTTDEALPPQDVMTDEEGSFAELETDDSWDEEERMVKAPPARDVTEQDMAQGGYISIRRTWTDTEFYRLHLAVHPGEGGITREIEAITWETGEGRSMSGEQAKIDVILLCRSHLRGCDLAGAPEDDILQFSALL